MRQSWPCGTSWRGRPGLYIAFNRSIAHTARRTFPQHVGCYTAHALAYRAVGHAYGHRLGGARLPAWRIAQILGISARGMIGKRAVHETTVASTAMRTVIRFCYSADREIGAAHVPSLRGIEEPELHRHLIDMVLPYARKAWADLQRIDTGELRFEHDHYLKMWQLNEPFLAGDFLLLDEAQDTNPVVEAVFTAQSSCCCSRLGESCRSTPRMTRRAPTLRHWSS
jgi:hypothetical protein